MQIKKQIPVSLFVNAMANSEVYVFVVTTAALDFVYWSVICVTLRYEFLQIGFNTPHTRQFFFIMFVLYVFDVIFLVIAQ
jgi:hypothetical protein